MNFGRIMLRNGIGEDGMSGSISKRQSELIAQIQEEIEKTPGDPEINKEAFIRLFNDSFTQEYDRLSIVEVEKFETFKRVFEECLLGNKNPFDYYQNQIITLVHNIGIFFMRIIRSILRFIATPIGEIWNILTFYFNRERFYEKLHRNNYLAAYYIAPTDDELGYESYKISNVVFNQEAAFKSIPGAVIQGYGLGQDLTPFFIKSLILCAIGFQIDSLSRIKLEDDEVSAVVYLCNKNAFSEENAVATDSIPCKKNALDHLLKIRSIKKTSEGNKIYLIEKVYLGKHNKT